jgi:hypothetical protein
MNNDTWERNLLSKRAKPGNWIIQIDSDEYLLNAAEFADWMRTAPENHCIRASWITVFKEFDIRFPAMRIEQTTPAEGISVTFDPRDIKENPMLNIKGGEIMMQAGYSKYALVVMPATEGAIVGTRLRGQYYHCRATHQPVAESPLKLLHYSWGRTPEELWQKLTNWSHSKDFDIKRFFDRWQSLTTENYSDWKRFHPLEAGVWDHLELAKITNVGGKYSVEIVQ